MISEGRSYVLNQRWLATFPGLAIFVIVLAAPHPAHVVRGEIEQVLALKANLALGDDGVAGQQTQHRQPGHRLAAARLPDHAEDLARLHGQADPAQGLHAPPAGLEVQV